MRTCRCMCVCAHVCVLSVMCVRACVHVCVGGGMFVTFQKQIRESAPPDTSKVSSLVHARHHTCRCRR